MRISVIGPRKLSAIRQRNPRRVELAQEWLSAQLDVLKIRQPDIQAVTSLQLGMDTFFASLCADKGIPYHVFLACKDQEAYWDVEVQEHFRILRDGAASVTLVTEEAYKPGCIGKQSAAITAWLKEEDSLLYVIKYWTLSQGQTRRLEELPKTQVVKYNMGRRRLS